MYKIGKFLIWFVGYFPGQKFIEGKVFYMRRIGYFSDPVLIIQDRLSLYGVAGFYIILPENSHKT